MKLGSASLFRRRAGDDHYKKLKLYGFDYSDYSITGALDGKTEEEYEQLVLREKKLADEAGIVIWQVHGPWRWPSRDVTEEDRAERLEKMIRSIRMTARLGCRYWVVHPIMPFGIEEKDSDLAAVTYEMNVAFMRELLTVAHEVDVIICLENMPMPHFSLGSPQAILNFVQEINDTHLKICLDTGHVSVFPSLRVGEAVRALGSLGGGKRGIVVQFKIQGNSGEGNNAAKRDKGKRQALCHGGIVRHKTVPFKGL